MGHPGGSWIGPARLGVGLLALALVAAACGTRLDDSAFEQPGEVVTVEEIVGDAAASGPVPDGIDGEDEAPTATQPDTTDDAGADGLTGDGGDGGDGGTAEGGVRGPNEASDVGITETTIRLGNITAESGVLGDSFAPAVRGLRAWVAATNARGGIGGRQIELFTCNDREDRSRTLECARQLVERDEVFALLAVNTRAFGGAAQYLHDQGVPVYGFPITNSFYRYPRMFSIYEAPYPRDGRTVGFDGRLRFTTGPARWFKEELGLTKAAVLSYDIAESRQAGEAFAEGFELEGFEVARYVVSFAAPSFEQAVADMERRGVEIVLDTMDDGANRRLCDAMSRQGFQPQAKVTTVVGFDSRIGQNYNETCRNVIFINGLSRPFTSDVPEVGAFRDAYARYQPGLPLHQWALEAWAIGNIFTDAMEAMGPAPTRDGLVEFLNTMPPNDAGGIMVGRDHQVAPYPEERAENCFVVARWLDSEGGWTQASDFPHCIPDARVYYVTVLEQGN